jgi:hypothetical protein
MNTNFKAAMEHVTNRQQDFQFNLANSFLVFLARIVGIVTNSEMLQNLTHDYNSSVYEERYVLPNTTKVIYGTFEPSGESVVVKGFKYIARSKQSLVRLIESELRMSRLIGYLSGFLLLVLVAWYLYSMSINVMAYIRKSRIDILSRIKKLVVDRYACKNCGRNLRCMILQPCTHLAICKDCLGRVGDVCPVCNKNFNSSV